MLYVNDISINLGEKMDIWNLSSIGEIKNKATINTCIQIFRYTCLLLFREGLYAGHRVSVCLTL